MQWFLPYTENLIVTFYNLDSFYLLTFQFAQHSIDGAKIKFKNGKSVMKMTHLHTVFAITTVQAKIGILFISLRLNYKMY